MADLEERDFDEKRLARRRRRKRSQLIAYIILIFILIIFASIIGTSVYFIRGFIGSNKAEVEIAEQAEEAAKEEAANTVIETPELTEEPKEYTEEDMLNEIIEQVIAEMSVEDKVAGLFVVTPEQLTGVDTAVKAGSGTQDALSSYAVGGIVYYPKNIKSTDQITEMLATTTSMSKYPVFTVISDQAMASESIQEMLGMIPEVEITDADSAYEAASKAGSALYKYGFNFAVSPNMDITENGQFSTDVVAAKDMATAYARGLKETGITSCPYVFPVKGETDGGMGIVDKSKDDLVINEYEPFKGAIDDGSAGAIMVTNASLPQVIGDNTPACLSEVFIQEELKGTLGYEGIIVTAPLNDGSVTAYYTSSESAVNAVKAGADMIYIPENFTEAYDGLLEAVKGGAITEERINDSLRRIFRIKYADKVSELSN